MPALVPAPGSVAPGVVPMPKSAPPEPEKRRGQLLLSVLLTPRDAQPVGGKVPIHWRVFADGVDAQGKHTLVAQSSEAAPTLTLPEGNYIVHVALDLASAVRRVTVGGATSSERLVLNAGAMRIVGMLGDKPINPAKLSISIFVPEAGNSEAKLVLAGAKAGDLIALPEGSYHVVSTLLDTAGYSGAQKSGVGNKTNSVVAADLKVQAGKLTDATLRHRSAVMTLKLVNDNGGEALANTAFTIPDAGRRRHPRTDRRLSLACAGRGRIRRHRPPPTPRPSRRRSRCPRPSIATSRCWRNSLHEDQPAPLATLGSRLCRRRTVGGKIVASTRQQLGEGIDSCDHH